MQSRYDIHRTERDSNRAVLLGRGSQFQDSIFKRKCHVCFMSASASDQKKRQKKKKNKAETVGLASQLIASRGQMESFSIGQSPCLVCLPPPFPPLVTLEAAEQTSLLLNENEHIRTLANVYINNTILKIQTGCHAARWSGWLPQQF